MRINDYVFWGILACIAAFYIFVGNDMYRERFEKLEAQKIEAQKVAAQKMDNNVTK